MQQYCPSHLDYIRPTGHLPSTATETESAHYRRSRVRCHIAGWHSSPLREFLVFRPTYRAVPKDNVWRPCGDYRALSTRINLGCYPVRHIHDRSRQLFGSVFSKIDLVTAYMLSKHPVSKF
jgi:hypothetical protein